MTSKKEKQFRQKLKMAAARMDVEEAKKHFKPSSARETAVFVNTPEISRLYVQLRRAEESGDMVKQNLIMQEIAKLETGA
jgi:HD superfamily phosphodiesterase